MLGYAGGAFGPATLRTIVGYAWTKTDTARSLAFPGFAGRASARYDGDVLHGVVEAGIARPLMSGTIEPFAGVELYRVHTDAFVEGTSAIALAGRDTIETFSLTTIGVRGQTPIVRGLSARSRIGWQHVLGDARPQAVLQFAGGSVPFAVSGAPLSRDSAAVALDLAWQPVERLTITSGYSGSIGGAGDDSRLRISLAFGF